MKKLIFISLALSFICLFVLSSCGSTDNNPPIDSNQQAGEGTSDDSDATDADTSDFPNVVTIYSAEIYEDYALLSLCDTITALGFQLTWNNEDLASFVCNDIKYVISISNKTLTKEGDDENYLICAPGNYYFVCEVRNETLMVDDNTIQCLFQSFLYYPIRISIDYNDNVVIITKQ